MTRNNQGAAGLKQEKSNQSMPVHTAVHTKKSKEVNS